MGTHYDLWMLPLGDSQPPYPFLESDHSARFAQFSPDGQFVAFSWAQSGRDEVFVQAPVGRTAGGGRFPRPEERSPAGATTVNRSISSVRMAK